MATEHVSRNATCKKCGSTTCTWQQNTEGKWYLTEIFVYDGQFDKTDYRDFHSKYCGKPDVHTAKQREITYREDEQEAARDAAADAREAERIEHEAQVLADWIQLDFEQRADRIAELMKQKARTLDGITMDYMTEFMRAQSEAASIQAEIDMCLDFDADLED